MMISLPPTGVRPILGALIICATPFYTHAPCQEQKDETRCQGRSASDNGPISYQSTRRVGSNWSGCSTSARARSRSSLIWMPWTRSWSVMVLRQLVPLKTSTSDLQPEAGSSPAVRYRGFSGTPALHDHGSTRLEGIEIIRGSRRCTKRSALAHLPPPPYHPFFNPDPSM